MSSYYVLKVEDAYYRVPTSTTKQSKAYRFATIEIAKAVRAAANPLWRDEARVVRVVTHE